MKILLILTALTLITSCSYKSDKDSGDSSGGATERTQESKPEENPINLKNIDTDGDTISDFDENERGLDLNIANIPEVNMKFLQNYILKVQFEDESVFEIDTITARNDPEFKYNVGKLLLRENSLNNAARVGKFSGISIGEINDNDMKWVQFPEIDKEFYLSKVHEFNNYQEKKIKESSIIFNNVLSLESTGIYEQIQNLEVNFYYYSHKDEKHILLHTEVIDSVFQRGIDENFIVSIHNPSPELLNDTYMKHGEFIISEVKDFYIPALKMKHSTLMKSVRNKTLPVYITTPLKDEIKYVAIDTKGEEFLSILNKAYGDNFKVESETLKKVNQFSNNLGTYEYLSELSGKEKTGRWFVMTNPIKEHYLKHKYSKDDVISISYMLGDEISKRVENKVFSQHKNITSTVNHTKVDLGVIKDNSRIDILIYPQSVVGRKVNTKKDIFRNAPGSCSGNCSGRNWWIQAEYTINSFSDFSHKLDYNSLDHALSGMKISINNTVLDIPKLFESNNAEAMLVNSTNGQYLKISILNIHELKVLKKGHDNRAYFVLSYFDKGTEAEGIRCDLGSGRNIKDLTYHIGGIISTIAMEKKLPLAITNWKFSEWEKHVHWGEKQPNGHVHTRGEQKDYFTGHVVDIVSTITNYTN